MELVAEATGAQPLKHGEVRTLNSAFEVVAKWWNGLPNVARVIGLYEDNRQARLIMLKEQMDKISGKPDPFAFLLEYLPEIYLEEKPDMVFTGEVVKEIAEAFSDDVQLLNSGETTCGPEDC